MTRPQRYQIPVLLLALLIAGCQAVPKPAGSVAVTEPPPALPDAPVYVVDPAVSEVRVLVWRDGPLSAVGHNHVLIAPVSGKVLVGETAAGSGFDLVIDANDFKVDPAEARAEEGDEFGSEISDKARRGTRENMLGPDVLDVERHPRIAIRSVSLSGPRWNPGVVAQLTLHGVTREIEFPAAVFLQGDTLTVIAQFSIRQSEFGIEPFSVFGGGLSVRDAIDVRVKLVARNGQRSGRKSKVEGRK